MATTRKKSTPKPETLAARKGDEITSICPRCHFPGVHTIKGPRKGRYKVVCQHDAGLGKCGRVYEIDFGPGA